MRLVYQYFGSVSFLMRAEPAKAEGAIRVECDVPDGSKLMLYSADEKEKNDYSFQNGACEVPAAVFSGGKNVFIGVNDTISIGTPIREIRSGTNFYLVGAEFGEKEERERLAQALIYVGMLAKRASTDSREALSLKGLVDQLYERANSGDIINF